MSVEVRPPGYSPDPLDPSSSPSGYSYSSRPRGYSYSPPRYEAPPVPGAGPSDETSPLAVETSFEQRAMEAINEIMNQEDVRASERYKGALFSRAREWLSREGKRTESTTLEGLGNYEQNPKWKKWVKIGAKIAGGTGIVAAMTLTGGAGAMLTPMLWAMGARELVNGSLEGIEELGWGRNRSRAELEAQQVLSGKIDHLKERVLDGDIDEAEFQSILKAMVAAEQEVIANQENNMRSEHKWRLGRSIASSVATLGAGLFAGIPLGVQGQDAVNEGHRVFVNMRGGQFLYNGDAELLEVAKKVAETNYPWTTFSDYWGATSHTLGRGLNAADYNGILGAVAYHAGRIFEEMMNRPVPKRKPVGDAPPRPYRAPYSGYRGYGRGPVPYSPYGAGYRGPSYSPDRIGPDGYSVPPVEGAPGVSATAEREETVDTEREAIESYVNTFEVGYKTELENAARALPPIDNRCRAVVCIPAAFSEHGSIYNTIASYLNQKTGSNRKLNPRLFEIMIFVNGPSDKEADIKKTVREINRFKKEHPELRVNAVSKMFSKREPIGKIRKYINDFALVRSNLRDNPENSLILVSNDADNAGVSERYISDSIREFNDNPDMKMIAGKDDYNLSEYKRYPYLLAARRLWQYIDIVQRYKTEGTVPKALGRNAFIRAQAYAEVGGYSRDASVAEDLIIGSDVASYYGGEAIQYKNIVLRTDPRRDLDAIQKGEPIVRAYDGFGADESLRDGLKVDDVESLTPDDPRFKDRLELDSTALFNDLWDQNFWPLFDRSPDVIDRRRDDPSAPIDDLWKIHRNGDVGNQSFEASRRVFDRAMGFWGATYELVRDGDGKVKVQINDWSKLKAGIERTASA